MKSLFLFTLQILLSFQLLIAQNGIKSFHYHNEEYNNIFSKFEGTIDNSINVTMYLNQTDSILEANYFYNKFGELIRLSGIVRDDLSFEFIEYSDENTDKYNSFDLKFNKNFDEISGIWNDVKRNKKLIVKLKKSINTPKVNLFRYENYLKRDEDDLNSKLALPENDVMIEYVEVILQNQSIQNKISNLILQQIPPNEAMFFDFYGFGEQTIKKKNLYSIKPLDLKKIMDSLVTLGSSVISITPISIENNILSIEKITSNYGSGGTGGMGASMYLNYNLLNGNQIHLNDIVNSSTQEKLFKIADSLFFVKNQQESSELLVGIQEDNFLLLKNGISFVYSNSSVGQISNSLYEVFVPYSKILTLIEPNSIVINLLK